MQQRPPISRGYDLWIRGVELIGIHYRVCRNLHGSLVGRHLGTTAPKMTAEAAERWRQSYQLYRQRKHAERKMRESAAEQETELAAPKGPHQNGRRKSASEMAPASSSPPPATLEPADRRLRRHIKILMRPASFDSPEGELGRRKYHHHHHRRQKTLEGGQGEGQEHVQMELGEEGEEEEKPPAAEGSQK